MKKLNADQLKERNRLADALDKAKEKLDDAVGMLNAKLAFAWEDVDTAQIEYVEAAGECEVFARDIQDAMQEYIDGKSEKWQTSDAGQNYDAWRQEWDAAADEFSNVDELAPPEDVEDPDGVGSETLTDLSTEAP